MPKARLMRPEFWTDDKVVGMTPLARLLFVGMWNFACDNGHLDDSLLQLRMRVLPGDQCDVGELLDEVLGSGMVQRKNGYLKVLNLAKQQPLDLRYLVFCDHCDEDDESHYSRADKKDGRGRNSGGSRTEQASPTGSTRGARGQHASDPRRGDGDGDGDGDGVATASRPRSAKTGSRISLDFTVDDEMRSWAEEKTPQVDVDSATEDFIDYWTGRAGREAVKLDWVATWRNSMRNCQTRGLHRKGGSDDNMPAFFRAAGQ